jgi:hypothetical protein
MSVHSVLNQITTLSAQAGFGPVTLVAAAKTQNTAAIRDIIAAGVTDIGENRVQELSAKYAQGAYQDAKLHFIGHLQRNKIAAVIGKIDLLQSLDSLTLADALEIEARKKNVVLDALIQVRMGGEMSKYGFEPDAIPLERLLNYDNLHIRGLMTIPPPSAVSCGNQNFFKQMRKIYVDIRNQIGDNSGGSRFDILSMGMSDDYPDAITEGSTMIRLGTALFGKRNTGQEEQNK